MLSRHAATPEAGMLSIPWSVTREATTAQLERALGQQPRPTAAKKNKINSLIKKNIILPTVPPISIPHTCVYIRTRQMLGGPNLRLTKGISCPVTEQFYGQE